MEHPSIIHADRLHLPLNIHLHPQHRQGETLGAKLEKEVFEKLSKNRSLDKPKDTIMLIRLNRLIFQLYTAQHP